MDSVTRTLTISRKLLTSAWIFFIDAGGSLYRYPISKSFEEWARPPSWGVVGRFISVTQVGDAAAVQLSFDRTSDKSSGWMDFHNLLMVLRLDPIPP
jgi:hypothetical protein